MLRNRWKLSLSLAAAPHRLSDEDVGLTTYEACLHVALFLLFLPFSTILFFIPQVLHALHTLLRLEYNSLVIPTRS